MKQRKSHFSIIIAVKNEAEGLARIISSVKKYSDDILIIDGHSTDNTRQIARQHGARFYLDHGRGRGDAVKIGLAKAKHPIVVFFDGDGSHNPADISALVAPIYKGTADLVFGSRRTGGSFDAELSIGGMVRSLGSDVLGYLVNLRFGTHLTDILYSFRAIRKSTALSLRLSSDDFCIEQEMIVKSLQKGIPVAEIPSRENARGWGVSKLKTITGIRLLLVLVRDLYFS